MVPGRHRSVLRQGRHGRRERRRFRLQGRQPPPPSIEVKANWIVIDEKDKPRFHWNYNEAGQLLGLVATHIISKDLPNWFWCTFEHVDNPGRGDFIGIHDSFGVDPTHTPSQTDKVGATYPPETMKEALLKLFEEYGYRGEWADEYKNYRLKGSQVDFTDGPGRSLLLGNSVTESGFVPSASCITCHARAAVNAGGGSSFPFFGEQVLLPLIAGDSLQPVLTYNGHLDPSWYFLDTGNGLASATCRPTSSGRSRSRPGPARQPPIPKLCPSRLRPPRLHPQGRRGLS